MIKKIFFSITISLSCTLLSASTLKQNLSDSTQKIFKKHKIALSQVGFSLIDTKSGENIKYYNGDFPFLAASLTKIYTSIYALKNLPQDFRFKTELYRSGRISGGVLKGDLILVGFGDPYLTHTKLMGLAKSLVKLGIKKIEGNLIIDHSNFPALLELSILGLGDQTYNTGLGALNLEFNRFKMIQKSPVPAIEHLVLEKNKKALTPGQSFLYIPNNDIEKWNYNPIGKYKYVTEVPIRKTNSWTGAMFKHYLDMIGIEAPAPKLGQNKRFSKLIKTIYSPSLSELISLMMEYSNNLFAEALLLKAAKKSNLKSAAHSMLTDLNKTYKINSNQKTTFENGSGLTLNNKVTPNSLGQFIYDIYMDKTLKTDILELLSIGGQTGWMARRFREPEVAFRVWAKTGSLDYVNNIAGIIFTKSKKVLAFSLFLNDFEKRSILQETNSIKINKIRDAAKKWKLKTTPFLDELITHWINTL